MLRAHKADIKLRPRWANQNDYGLQLEKQCECSGQRAHCDRGGRTKTIAAAIEKGCARSKESIDKCRARMADIKLRSR